MLTPDQLEALRLQASQITDPIVEYLLEDIARRISEAGQLTSTASYQVWRAQNLGMSQREIKKRLKKMLKVSNRELRRLLTQAAEVGYDYDIKRLPQVQAVAFAQNAELQRIVSASVAMAQEELVNITQTLGMVDPYGKALPLRDAYRSCMDFAFESVATGAMDYNTAIRRATKHLAEKGVRTIDYESGVHTSLEAATRRNIMGALGLMVEQTSAVTHDQLGCDGWEISAHANSAPDHEPIQGKQYPDKEYEALNNSLVRRIGTLNCGHIAFPIILGVNRPQYTQEQLDQFRADNKRGVTFEGKHYTGYEATQAQRRLERAIRKQKTRCLLCEAAGDKEGLTTAQIRLQTTRQAYKRFSRGVGLRTEDERLHVAGFGRKPASAGSVVSPVVSPGSEDVTSEYLRKATPGQGTIEYGEGYNKSKHKEEVDVANWLHNTYGGDIELLTEASAVGVKMPDYKWRGKLWELKTTSTLNATDNQVRSAIKQIQDNPGGIILDYSDLDIDLDALVQVITGRTKRTSKKDLDVIIKSKGKAIKVLRHKKT